MEVWNQFLLLLVFLALAVNGEECPDGFSRDGDYCYRYVNDDMKTNWNDAELYCNQFTTSGPGGIMGHLASIHNAEENNVVSSKIALGVGLASDGVGPDSWIGLYRIDNDNFAWSDGTPLDFEHWHSGEPNSHGTGYCVNTNQAGQRGRWDDQPCSYHTATPFICKITVDTTFWTSFAGSMYRFYCDQTTWDDAQTLCESESAHLVIIDETDENDFVSTLTASSTTKAGPPTWIGLKEKPPVSFKWIDGSDYVGDYNRPLSCVHTNDGTHRGEWNNGDCSNGLAFVCERNE